MLSGREEARASDDPGKMRKERGEGCEEPWKEEREVQAVEGISTPPSVAAGRGLA